MKFRAMRTLLVLPVFLATMGTSEAAMIWEWSLNDWEPTVSQNDSVVLTATLYNSEVSNETITAASFVDAWFELGEDLPYSFAYANGGLSQQFSSLNLNPGEAFEFTLGTLTPQATVAAGQYYVGGFTLAMQDMSGQTTSWTPDRSLYLTVEEAAPGHSVPEPSTLLMLLAGGLGLILTRRKLLATPKQSDLAIA